MSVVTSRSQVRQRSSSRIDAMIGVSHEVGNLESRYNERIAAFNRVVKSTLVAKSVPPAPTTPKSARTNVSVCPSPIRKNLGLPRAPSIPDWKRLREQTERAKRRPSCSQKVKTCTEIEKILQNLNRVKCLLETSS